MERQFLPVVAVETGAALAATICDYGAEEFVDKVTEKIHQLNPDLPEILTSLFEAGKRSVPKKLRRTAFGYWLAGACMMYCLLESQLESAEMNESTS